MRRSLALLALLFIPTVSARGGMPSPLTDRGEVIEGIYYPIFVAATVVFLIVVALLVYVMVRFRAGSGHGRETFELERDNMKLEMTWIGIPLIVVLWVGVISYGGLVELDEGISEDEAWMELGVTGYQWTWLADYGSDVSLFSDPDPNSGDVSDDKVFVVPADVPIRFNVTGGDVIHAWHLMDANWATVALIDANPYGPHKYTTFSAVLPEGDYQVQCREMCFNPGHGYMRARISAVPMAEFEGWMEEQHIAAGAALPQPMNLVWNGEDFERTFEKDENENDVEILPKFVAGDGSRVIVTVQNNGDSELLLDVPGYGLKESRFRLTDDGPTVESADITSVTVPAQSSARFAFETPTLGNGSFEANGASLDFNVVEAEVVTVELGDLFIEPTDIDLEAGTTYLFQVVNVGAQAHNFFIGLEADAGGATGIASSATIPGGATTNFLYTPTEAMQFSTWCNVPGHYPAMSGVLTVR